MTSPLSTGNRWVVLGVTAVLMTCGAAISGQAPAAALINESPSLPRGLYVRIPGGSPTVGSVVAAPQPTRARPYLASLGMPADVLLIKRVAAGPGDAVCRSGAEITAGDRTARVALRDRAGASLPVWRGCRVLAADELFVLGDTRSSFDSRYFGPVSREEITGVYREVLRW